MNMDRIKIPENVEKKAKLVWGNVNENIKKLEEKAQPKLNDLQKKLTETANVDALLEKTKVNEYKEKIIDETNNLRERATTWLEEGYVNVLDLMGLATKDEVDTLRKKLTRLQGKVNKLNKSLSN